MYRKRSHSHFAFFNILPFGYFSSFLIASIRTLRAMFNNRSESNHLCLFSDFNGNSFTTRVWDNYSLSCWGNIFVFWFNMGFSQKWVLNFMKCIFGIYWCLFPWYGWIILTDFWILNSFHSWNKSFVILMQSLKITLLDLICWNFINFYIRSYPWWKTVNFWGSLCLVLV